MNTEDFEEHGVSVIQEVRESRPEAYLKLVGDLVPREFNLGMRAPKMVSSNIGTLSGNSASNGESRTARNDRWPN
jgi:hypothetical protein